MEETIVILGRKYLRTERLKLINALNIRRKTTKTNFTMGKEKAKQCKEKKKTTAFAHRKVTYSAHWFVGGLGNFRSAMPNYHL